MLRPGPPIPTDNVYLVQSAEDLPDALSQWTLYNLLYDPGDGIGLYFSSDGITLIKLASGGGGGGVDSFIGRTGAVVAVEEDYELFYLLTGETLGPPFFGKQTVEGDVLFTGRVEITNVDGVVFGPSTEVELRNPADNTTWFLQYTTFFCQFGLAGPDFQDIFFDFTNSFTHFRFGAPILIQERAAAINGPSTHGQLWVRDDDPNVLMYTDGNDDDFVVDVTPA